MAQLRKLSEHCQYGASLDDMLHDRLVCGLRDVKIQRQLLARTKLTFKEAFDLTQAAETAERSAKELQGQHAGETASVLAVQQPRLRSTSEDFQGCYRCGGQHPASACRFVGAECHNCGKRGRVCRSKEKKKTQEKQWGRR